MQCWHCFREVNTSGACPFCGWEQSAIEGKYPLALKPGSILNGRYILGHVLGQGGFGVTYIAWDDRTGDRVAIKEYLPTDFAGRTPGRPSVQVYSGGRAENFAYGKQQFLEEARTLAAFIGDRHLVRIYSYFEENGTAYFCMEYVDGLPLDKYMAAHGGRLTPAEAERLLLPLMESLENIHAKGIIHRDIAPDNILVTADGEAKLIDFGAARYSTGEKSKSLDVILKHGFAPKEQYLRRGRQGPWTDVYSMGATWYYAITGKVPPEAIERIDEDGMIPPRMLGVKITPEAEDALYTAMEVNAADRFQTMAAFHRAMLDASPNARAEEERLTIEQKEREARAFLAKLEAERREQAEREEKERLAREKAEQEAREQAEREEKERREREAREEAERRRKEEEERRAQEKAEREERERKKREAKAEAERKKREEKERLAREKAERIEREKQEKAALQEAKRQAKAADGDKPKKSKLPLILAAVAVLAVVLLIAFGGKMTPEVPAVSEEAVETIAPMLEPTPEPTPDAAYEEEADKIVAVAAGNNHTVVLYGDGTAAAVGNNQSRQCELSDWENIRAVAAGEDHTVGLQTDGTVLAVGSDEKGQCNVDSWRTIVAVAAGGKHTVGLRSDGTVRAVGDNSSGQCNVGRWTKIVAIAASSRNTVGLRRDGSVCVAGDNSSGQCDVSGWENIASVASGGYYYSASTISNPYGKPGTRRFGGYTLGLCSNGTVVAVGRNEHGQCDVSKWTDIIAIATGYARTVALKADGTVVITGNQRFGGDVVSGWKDIVAVAAGENHIVGLKTDGTVVAAGENCYYGQEKVDELNRAA